MFGRLKLEEGWTTLILLWLLITVAAIAIISAEYTDEGIEVLLPVSSAAVFAGLALAKSNFRGQRAHIFALVYGIALIAFLVGRTLPGEELTWRMRILDLAGRQIRWMQQAVEGGANRDSLIFVLQTAGVFWLLGYTAAWYTFRKPRVWRVVVPTGLVLLSVVYYYNGPKALVVYLGIYALLALLFVARTHLVDRERGWRAAAVRYEEDIRFDFLRAAFVVGALSLLLASTLPALGANNQVTGALATVDRPWRRFQDNWTRLFASLNSYGITPDDAYQDTMQLGGARNPGNRLIMDIQVPAPVSSIYWQGVVLDTYHSERGWSNSTQTTLLNLPTEGRLAQPELLLRTPFTQTVVNYTPNSGTLYAASQFIATNKQTFIDVGAVVNSEVQAINWVRSRYVLRAGDAYTVISDVSIADKTSLRNAGVSYPQWVRDSYLQTPDTLTAETRALAAELAAPYDNAFDKAIAIRDYLRATIAYNDQIDTPPPGVEPVHYVLFESQEAYCTYYATAMAMMLRAEGVPARIVNGYSMGEFLPDSSSYRVRSNNAHTWVEVFFPRYGWIIFEPTSSIPVVELPEGEASGNPGDAFDRGFFLDSDQPVLDDDILSGPDRDFREDLRAAEEAREAAAAEERRRLIVSQAVGGSVLLAMAGALVLAANYYNHQVESDVERSYDRLASWARWLGLLFRPVDTPYERANQLVEAVPDGREPIRKLTHQYVLRRFSRNPDGDAEFDPRAEWKQLRPLLLRRSLRESWNQLWRR